VGKKKNGSILVLDDDFDISNLLRISLKKRGYSVFAFTDPILALEHFKVNHSTYSLVITDLRMPGMSGFEFLHNVKLVKPETKVILMSAFDIKGDIEFTSYSRDNAIEDFIQKPLAMKNLFRIVESHMTAK
jgi:two-component system, cell cycle response regulator CpdR